MRPALIGTSSIAASRPQRPSRSQVQRLHERARSAAHAADQARVQTARRHRTVIGHLRRNTTWAATMSPAAMAIASTPCSPAARSVGHHVSPIPRH